MTHNPYLLRAAKFHGKPSQVMCPICRKEQLTLVSWVFGDHLGAVSGSARTAEELVMLATRFEEFCGPRGGGMPNLQLEPPGQVVRDRCGTLAPREPAARGRRATAPARPVNNEGRHDQSRRDANGSATERVGKHARPTEPEIRRGRTGVAPASGAAAAFPPTTG